MLDCFDSGINCFESFFFVSLPKETKIELSLLQEFEVSLEAPIYFLTNYVDFGIYPLNA